jgi:hypothetical protein
VPDALPDFLTRYLEQRAAAHAAAARDVLTALTDRERALVKDAAVMGYVRGTLHPRGEPVPKDSAIVTEVIDACLAFPDLYPAINPPQGDEPDDTEEPTR